MTTSVERRHLDTDVVTPVDVVTAAGATGRLPAVVLLHDTPGPAAALPVAARLAARGHLVAVPHHLVRGGVDDPEGDRRRGAAAVLACPDLEVVNDLFALLEALAADPRCSGGLAALGLGAGGRLAVLLATSPSSPERVVAVQPPGLVKATALHDDRHPQIPVQRLQRLRAALLGIYREEDTDPSPAHAAEVHGILDLLTGAEHRAVVVSGPGDGVLDVLDLDSPGGETAWREVEAWLTPTDGEDARRTTGVAGGAAG